MSSNQYVSKSWFFFPPKPFGVQVVSLLALALALSNGLKSKGQSNPYMYLILIVLPPSIISAIIFHALL